VSQETVASQGPITRGAYPELSPHAVIVGYFLGVLIAVSIGYASLSLGFSIEGSELAAILGFGILRGILRRRSIVENNVTQTVASAVNGASSGMMFSVPAIFILGYGMEFNPYVLTFGAIAGAFLGIAFIIPLRKQMIDFERLTYPGGVAVATILKSPGAGVEKAKLLLGAMVLSGLVAFAVNYQQASHDKVLDADPNVIAAMAYDARTAEIAAEVAATEKALAAAASQEEKAQLLQNQISLAGILEQHRQSERPEAPTRKDYSKFKLGDLIGAPSYFNITLYVSLMTIGVGFIAGRGGVAFIIGGYACYFLLAPMLNLLDMPVEGVDITSPGALMSGLFRPTGIGMLIGGAVIGVMFAFPLIRSAINSMQSSAKVESAMSRDEMPIKLLYIAIGGATVLLAIMAITSAEQTGIVRGLMMAVLGTLWIWMAGIILSEAIGRTNWSPLSGMTLIAVTILIMITQSFGGMDTMQAIVASVTVGAATCVAMSQATDLMLDLKTGYLVGATPRMQQLGQFCGAWLGPIVIIVLIFVLHNAYGLGSEKLPAPQGQALASMVNGITGGDVPMEKYIAGAALGALLSAVQGGLGITVGLGFYLPFYVVITYSLGTLLREISDRRMGKNWSDNKGIPFAAGLIVGEALVGVGFAIYMIVTAS